MTHEIIEKLKKEIEGFKDEVTMSVTGEVVEAADGVVKAKGLSKVMSQEMVMIETSKGDVKAVVFNLEETLAGIIVLGDFSHVKVGDAVRPLGKVLSVPVGRELVGRVVDPLGEPLDGKGPIFDSKKEPQYYFVERNAPSVLARESVNTPLHTGIKAIDSMIPIGRGQRELIIGDRQTGKTAIAVDTILNQKNDTGRRTPICIYVAIGQKQATVAKLVKTLTEAGAMQYTIVVVAPSSAPAPLQYLAPYSGCAMGEYFMDKGEDVLIIYDDLSKHANAYRQISLLLRRPPGREAYPGDIFYLHSRLLERAAKMSKEKGGGSITALPIIETQLGDISAYIPTNVISITDGQIYLESDLFYKGVRPAVNAGLSVSRVGSSAQTKAIKKVAGKLRLELAQFRELQAFVQFASDLDEGTRNKIVRGQLMTEILKQNDGEPVSFERQAVLFYAALQGFLNTFPIESIRGVEEKLMNYFEKLHEADILKPIRESGELKEEVEHKLRSALERFLETTK